MEAGEFVIERKSRKHNVYGIIGTTLVHGIIVSILFFYVLYPPDPPLEFKGMMMSLGEENMGGPADNPVPDPSTQEQYIPISEQTDEPTPLTADDAESVNIKEKTKPKTDIKIKPLEKTIVQEKKPVLELPKKVNQQALFRKKSNSNQGGYGDGSELGNEGREDGSENGSKDGKGGGDSGFGTADKGQDGVSFNLADRKIKQLPVIEDNSKSVGKVVVKIIVNRNGDVIKAMPGQVGSTTTEAALLQKAKEGALRTKFSARSDGQEEQYGTMTFVFKFKP
jgi:outer membrane biosynthesis protein TonB